MIKVDKLSYSFPQKNLYDKISFTIEEGQHCAFIGVSGSGKSTLADIFMDPESYMFDGKLDIDPHCRIGYVSQFAQIDSADEMTVFEYIGDECIKLQNELSSICSEMETSSDIEPLLEKYQETLDAFDAIGGDSFESIIDRKLNTANLTKHRNLKVSELSGGEFKLVQVIKEMLNSPDLMIMDEPDVFLDFENLNSLKNLINSHKGALLVITHNRYLLNHCFNKILHLENMELQEFDGTYIDYNFSLLENKIELQELAHGDTEELARNEALIDRLRTEATEIIDASRGRTLKARVKLHERLESRRIKAPFVYIKQPNIRLSTDNEVEETVALKVENHSVAFDETLLDNISFEINSGDKVALIGANGTGKTTLLRDIFEKSCDSISFGENIETACLSQLKNETLIESNTVMEEFFDFGFKSSEDIISCLSEHALEEELVSQKISSLSGGEKNMIQLAKLSSSNANMLLLDEPTSHLDTYSQIALEEAISNYNGAVLMVSHDFYSIINCMDYVLIIEDKGVRRMSMRKFRKMIYDNHFDKNYLELEQKKKELETRVALALKDNDFELARTLCEELEPLIKLF